MAISKILYFTAGPVATSAELAEIATIKAIAAQQYEVRVMNGRPKAYVTATTISAAASDNSYNDAGSSLTASTISAAASDNSINDSGNGFVTAGFQVGDPITVSGFTGDTHNNATRVATAVTAGKITFAGTDGDSIVDDSAGESVTVSAPGRFLAKGFKNGMTVMVRGFTGNTANNISAAKITALTANKMTIGGTDGDVIVDDAAGEAVTISDAKTDTKYGTLAITADYTAGTVPEAYKSGGNPIYPTFDPANPPDGPALIATQAVVSNGETVAVKTNAGNTSTNATATVAAHACTVALPATKAIVSSTQEIPITSGSGTTKVTLTIAAGAISACVLS